MSTNTITVGGGKYSSLSLEGEHNKGYVGERLWFQSYGKQEEQPPIVTPPTPSECVGGLVINYSMNTNDIGCYIRTKHSSSEWLCNDTNLTHYTHELEIPQNTDVNLSELCGGTAAFWFERFPSGSYNYQRYRNVTRISKLLGTCNLTSMQSMFAWLYSLADVNTKGWDTSHVGCMNSMFGNCTSLASLDLSGWDVSNVSTFAAMFYGCNNLTTIDLSGWKIQEDSFVDNMFGKCSKLETIYMRGCDDTTVEKIREALRQVGLQEQVTIITH